MTTYVLFYLEGVSVNSYFINRTKRMSGRIERVPDKYLIFRGFYVMMMR